jgi:hypothetical protein
MPFWLLFMLFSKQKMSIWLLFVLFSKCQFKCYCEEQFFVTEIFQWNLVLKGVAETACWELANRLKTFGLENKKKYCLLLMLLTVLHVNNFKDPPLP